ncbi:methylornithine synthase PylB [Methanimicrococcus blatticola]|uniref:Pyrrolysine biosynthesis protein PylB n=1 Tax=Methanimicrococcus blatticola TaxID=91560 RepID=A0A484F4Q4_9EURY|nr:methylornithine synthase PylB [Methanimicrococcus blatticola]MCC2508420.1 methylornithine synthase PylB [Methanimicrococcus blatticola]TDQ70127.1 pyrrolysine biosynthesis protein PylB [Methanimicrococcus blatticola]
MDYFSKMSDAEYNQFIEDIIQKKSLTDDDIRSMLSATDKAGLQRMFDAAVSVKNHYFGNDVYLYSFVYFSTYCKNQCTFCYYNAKNKIDRYRITPEELRTMCEELKNEGVHMIDLTMGEDPHFHNKPENLLEFVRIAKEVTGLPVMVSPGVVDNDFIQALSKEGANFFALYQETYQEELYEKLRAGQSFEERFQARLNAKAAGICIEDGILTGFSKMKLSNGEPVSPSVSDDIESAVASIRGMQKADPDQVRVMTFEPQPGTPLAGTTQASDLMELKVISVLRFVFPDRLIPASLDVAGIPGMVDRLNAGANVVTSIISADSKLEGVVNFDRDVSLNERKRDAKSVIEKLNEMGLARGSQENFEAYLNRNKSS